MKSAEKVRKTSEKGWITAAKDPKTIDKVPRIAEKEMKSIEKDGMENDQYDVEGQFQDLVEHKGQKSKVSEPLRQCNEILKVSRRRDFSILSLKKV